MYKFFQGILIAIIISLIMAGVAYAVAFGVFQGGTGQTTFSQYVIVGAGGSGALTASGTPTFVSFHATSTSATSTIAFGLQVLRLNITSATASSTFANGIVLSGGCFQDPAGNCVGGGSTNWSDQGAYLQPLTATDGIIVGSGSSTISYLTIFRSTTTEATTTILGVYSSARFGGSATSSFDSAGALTLASALAVGSGGTGATSLTDGGILLGSGTGAITPLGVAANGQIPIGDGTTDPVLATLTGTSLEVDISNGAGSITIGIPSTANITTALGVASTSPAQELSVVGDVYLTSGLGVGIATTVAGNIQATGVLVLGGATSTFANGVRLNAGCFVDASGSCVGGGTPGGSNTQVQYNNSSAFGGMAEFTYASPTLTVSSAGVLDMDSALTLLIPVSASSTITATGGLEIDTTDIAVHFNSGGTTYNLPSEKCVDRQYVGILAGEVAPFYTGFNFPFTVTEVKAKADITATSTGRINGTGLAYSGYGWEFYITHGTAVTASTTVDNTVFNTATSTFQSYTSGFDDASFAVDELAWVHVANASTSANIGSSTVTLLVEMCGQFAP